MRDWRLKWHGLSMILLLSHHNLDKKSLQHSKILLLHILSNVLDNPWPGAQSLPGTHSRVARRTHSAFHNSNHCRGRAAASAEVQSLWLDGFAYGQHSLYHHEVILLRDWCWRWIILFSNSSCLHVMVVGLASTYISKYIYTTLRKLQWKQDSN